MTGTIALPRSELGKLLAQILRVLLSRLDELSLVSLEEGDGRGLGGGDVRLRYEVEDERQMECTSRQRAYHNGRDYNGRFHPRSSNWPVFDCHYV
jgi:hypothetical protein